MTYHPTTRDGTPLASFFVFEFAKDFCDATSAARSVVRSDGVVLAKKWASHAYVPAKAAVLDAMQGAA